MESLGPAMELASRQHGLITRGQAESCGLGVAAVGQLLRNGRWERIGRNVYRVSGSPRTWHQALLGEVLVAGHGAAAAARSSAALWHVPGFDSRYLDVVRSYKHSRSGRRLRESLVLPVRHVTVHEGIPATVPARVAFELCGHPHVHPKRAERALDNILSMNLASLGAMREVLAVLGRRGRRGSALFRALLDVRDAGYVPVASENEALLLTVIEAAGLPSPDRQVAVGGDELAGRVDFVYRQFGIIIEADSRRHHSSWLDLESDRRRDAKAMAGGWAVLRTSWVQLCERPEEFIQALRGLIESRRHLPPRTHHGFAGVPAKPW